MVLKSCFFYGICIVGLLCLGTLLMGKKSGNKRKKDKDSPTSQSVDQENKRLMANYNGFCATSPVQGLSQPQPQSGQFNSHIAPATFTYTPNMLNSGPPVMNMPQPQSPNTMNGGSDQGVMGLILQRLEIMDKKLGQLDAIHSTISTITVKVNDIEGKMKDLESKVSMIENSRDFDTESVNTLNKKQKEIDSLLNKMKTLEADQSAKESSLKAQMLDMQCRSMRDNLLFYRIPEERGETDDDCMRKVLEFIENTLELKMHKERLNYIGPIAWVNMISQKSDP